MMTKVMATCNVCGGKKLKPLYVIWYEGGKNIHERVKGRFYCMDCNDIVPATEKGDITGPSPATEKTETEIGEKEEDDEDEGRDDEEIAPEPKKKTERELRDEELNRIYLEKQAARERGKVNR